MQSKNALEYQCRNSRYIKFQKVTPDVTVIRIQSALNKSLSDQPKLTVTADRSSLGGENLKGDRGKAIMTYAKCLQTQNKVRIRDLYFFRPGTKKKT